MQKKNILTLEEVNHITKLSALELSPEETEKYRKQLALTIKYVDELQKVDTKKTEPTSNVGKLTNVFREDKVILSLTQKETISNSKSIHKGFFKVKAVLEEK